MMPISLKCKKEPVIKSVNLKHEGTQQTCAVTTAKEC